MENIFEDYFEFFEERSDISSQKKDNKNQLFNLDIESISENDLLHYICIRCLKFPFIKLCKDRKNIRLTCSCYNNKKILIEDLFLKDYTLHFSTKYKNLFSTIKKKKILKIFLYARSITKYLKAFQ